MRIRNGLGRGPGQTMASPPICPNGPSRSMCRLGSVQSTTTNRLFCLASPFGSETRAFRGERCSFVDAGIRFCPLGETPGPGFDEGPTSHASPGQFRHAHVSKQRPRPIPWGRQRLWSFRPVKTLEGHMRQEWTLRFHANSRSVFSTPGCGILSPIWIFRWAFARQGRVSG